MKIAYYTVDGELIAESMNGNRLDYLRDALGSITAKVDQTLAVVSTLRYKPYGGVLYGTAYTFGWLGSFGYRLGPSEHFSHYVRNRHYSQATCEWTSVDKYWPSQSPYGYAYARPVQITDWDGLAPKVSVLRSIFYSADGAAQYGNPVKCGKVYALWRFDVDPIVGVNGWIIQKVESSYHVTKCDPSVPSPDLCPKLYYEAFRVTNGKVERPASTAPWVWFDPDTRPMKREHDAWNRDEWGKCTEGEQSVHGELMFVSKEDRAENDDEWLDKWGLNQLGVHCAGDLPSSETLANGKTFVSSGTGGNGDMSITWGCCKIQFEHVCLQMMNVRSVISLADVMMISL